MNIDKTYKTMKKTTMVHAIIKFIAGTIMKKCIFILSLASLSMVSIGNPPLVSKHQMAKFVKSKTCIVLENSNIEYNGYIMDAVEKYWKSTEYEFIDQQEFQKRRYDTKYSFLVLLKDDFDKYPSYNNLSLVMGDAVKEMNKMPQICSIPLSYSDDENMDYAYAIPSILKFMQKHAKNLEKNNRFLISLEGLQYYNFSAVFRNKVLLLNKDMMASNANSPEKIKNVYPYYFKLLTTSEIEKEIAANPTKTMFNIHIGPTQNTKEGKCLEMIFDSEGNLYYYNSRNVSDDSKNGFNLKDLSNITTQ
jgi:hypothetical protein